MKAPHDLALPWQAWRTGQQLAIRTGLSKKKRHVVIQAPTGAGKTAIGGGLAQIDGKRVAILTATNGLMRQYEHLLPWLMPIRGAVNYPCLAARDELRKYFRLVRDPHSITCDDGPCRSNVPCSLKESGCEYFDALRTARSTRTIITNYSYWLAIHRYGKGLNQVERLICDEAHDLADQLMKASEIQLPKHLLRGERWPRTIKGWKQWAESRLAVQPPAGAERDDERVRVTRLREILKQLTQMDEETWAYDLRYDTITFQPVIPRLLMPMLAGDQTQIVYLSATITPTTLDMLGIAREDVEYHVMPSRFDPARRPVYVVKCTRVDSRMSDVQREYWIYTIDRIIGPRKNVRGLIHSVSYDRAEYIKARSKYSSRMITHQPGLKNLDRALREFDARPDAILVSPALTTGYDFAGDRARFQILAKLPFPDTRSNIMKARIAHTPGYNDHLTMQQIVQTVGRVMRSENDWGESFIVDNHADWFLSKHADLAPENFQEALVWTKRVPDPLGTSPSL